MHWIYLSIAIVSEVVGTTALKAAAGFTRLGPSLLVVVGYAVAFYFLALTLRTLPVAVAYAVWCAAGIALVSVAGWVVYGQRLDLPAIVGMLLMVAGIVVLTGFSAAVGH